MLHFKKSYSHPLPPYWRVLAGWAGYLLCLVGCWLPAEQVRVQAGWLGVPYYTHYAGQVTLFVLVAMLLLQILLGWRQGKWYKTPAYTASLYLLGFTAHRIWLTQQSDGWVRPGYGAYLVLVGSALLLVFTMLYRHKAIPNLEA